MTMISRDDGGWKDTVPLPPPSRLFPGEAHRGTSRHIATQVPTQISIAVFLSINTRELFAMVRFQVQSRSSLQEFRDHALRVSFHILLGSLSSCRTRKADRSPDSIPLTGDVRIDICTIRGYTIPFGGGV